MLYVLIALAGWCIWRAGFRPGKPNAARKTLALYIVQLALNSLWSPIFFAGYPLIGDAAWWIALVIILALIASVIWLAIAAAKWSQAAMWIMIPYLLWLAFATSLNLAILVLN